MLNVLGIDPSFTNTGIALVADGVPLFTKSVKLISEKDSDKGKQLSARIEKLFEELDGITDAWDIDVIGVERTDWAMSLGMRGDWRQRYARERRAQEALALLQGAIAGYCIHNSMALVLVGVNEWHRAFGAGNKTAIADLLALEYSQVTKLGDAYYFTDRYSDSHVMKNDETDALGIARVVYDMKKQELMVEA